MVSLKKLVSSISVEETGRIHDYETLVRGVTCDSRAVKPGYVFAALQGEKSDGHHYVHDAVERGCLAAVIEKNTGLPVNVPFVKVADSHQAYGLMAAEYFGHPARGMKIIGLTGTNGKTTTSWIIEQAVRAAGGSPGVIGTVNYRYSDGEGRRVELDAPLTTPEPVMLQGLLRQMNDAGASHVIVEVSSHSLAQQRLAGVFFDVAIFTNLSRDHLDYHENMEAYFGAKLKLFEKYLKPSGTAVVAMGTGAIAERAGDDWGRRLVDHLVRSGFSPCPVTGAKRSYMTSGFTGDCTVRADQVKQNVNGLSYTMTCAGKSMHIQSELIGKHNISNMLTAAAACFALGLDSNRVAKGMQEVHTIPGRLEPVVMPCSSGGKKGAKVFVDYAHTPDALENVLRTLRAVTSGRLYCVFGCGGDRDKGKRPLMGAVAAGIADAVVVTSDNPRGEEPGAILTDIEEGVRGAGMQKMDLDNLFAPDRQGKGYSVLADRQQAIHQVCSRTLGGDVVLIAGKGHETYQITAAGKSYFDDRIEARNGGLRWTGDHLIAATAGRIVQKGDASLLGRISTDTRTLKPGDVFVALSGENFDGHDFIGTAIQNGAAALIVEKNCAKVSRKVGVVQVADALKALGDLARYRRALLGKDVKVIAITGSSGKTTVKEMTASIFEAAYVKEPGSPVLKTMGNLNNLIGLPLSLLNINAEHRVAVMEMGMNRPGEIDRLARIADPDIACITNVQGAHLEGLGSIEGVARAKGELFAATAVQGVRVVNYDDPQVRKLGDEHGDNVIGFAVTPVGRRYVPAVRATRIVSRGERGMRFTLHVNDWRKRIDVPAAGMHNVANCAAAAAIATAGGVAPEIIVEGLVGYSSGDKRLQIEKLPGGINIVNDAYNANPASMAAALRTVMEFGGQCRRVALLGDMFELGAQAPEAHREVGKLTAELGFDYLAVTGEFAETVADEARRAGMIESRVMVCSDRDAMAKWVAELIDSSRVRRGDWLLIKGSRGMRMELMLKSLNQRLQQEAN